VAIADRWRHAALKDVHRTFGKVELLLVDAFSTCRVVLTKLFKQQFDKAAGIVLIFRFGEDLEISADVIFDDERVDHAPNDRVGISIISPAPGEKYMVTARVSGSEMPLKRPTQSARWRRSNGECSG
jgi:hypothetical protein